MYKQCALIVLTLGQMLRPKTPHLKTFAQAAAAVDELLASQAHGESTRRDVDACAGLNVVQRAMIAGPRKGATMSERRPKMRKKRSKR
jgi:hypothetical protein